MYKLVAMDLDGTLLNKDKEISERNKRAIQLAKKRGVKMVVCSGRVYTGARLYAKQLGIVDPIIACNGAIICENSEGRIIYSNYLSNEVCQRIIEICHKYNIYYHVYAGETMLTEQLGHTSLRYYERNKTLPPKDRVDIEVVTSMMKKIQTYDGKVLKFVVISEDSELLRKVRSDVSEISSVDIMSSNFDNFEVVTKGVSKGAALKKLSDMLDISADEMIAIGDNENDISMLEYAGLGIAMKNGEACAKEAAKYITGSNVEDGVAEAIERFILV